MCRCLEPAGNVKVGMIVECRDDLSTPLVTVDPIRIVVPTLCHNAIPPTINTASSAETPPSTHNHGDRFFPPPTCTVLSADAHA